MRTEQSAEWILSLVTTPERASSTVGDLLEDVPARGWTWFWLCVVRTAVSIVGQTFAGAPLTLVVQATLGWLHYLLAGLLLGFAAIVIGPLAWGLLYFFTHHTSLEILTNLLKIRIDWIEPPLAVTVWAEAAAVWVIAPFITGTSMPRSLPGREIVTWLLMVLLSPVPVYVNFKPRYIRIDFYTLPLILASMFRRHFVGTRRNRAPHETRLLIALPDWLQARCII